MYKNKLNTINQTNRKILDEIIKYFPTRYSNGSQNEDLFSFTFFFLPFDS